MTMDCRGVETQDLVYMRRATEMLNPGSNSTGVCLEYVENGSCNAKRINMLEVELVRADPAQSSETGLGYE